MLLTYPRELEEFVRQELASGIYENEDQLVFEALKVLRELKIRHEELRADIQRAVSEVELGKTTLFDAEAFKKEARRRRAELE